MDITNSYFRADNSAEPDPDTPPRIVRANETGQVEVSPGLRFRPVFGQSALLNHVHFDPHTEVPMHHHPEEQMGTVLEGELEFEMGGEIQVLHPGDVWVVPPNVPHAARTRDTPCVALDIFSPPRSGFRELIERASQV
ncbi:MAG: cupin domain-containing protein [Chloroflexota bacterium]|nr:cupin domain-containing protein [Chloroflexota bacterium]